MSEEHIFMVSNAEKKSFLETEEWRHSENPDWRLFISTVWRGGMIKLYVEPAFSEPFPVDGQDGIQFEDYEYCELDSCYDSCQEDLIWQNVPEDIREKLEEGYYEEFKSYLEDEGWEPYDVVYEIEGKITVDEL